MLQLHEDTRALFVSFHLVVSRELESESDASVAIDADLAIVSY